MIARLKLWAAAVGLVVAALLASWFGGRKSARTDTKLEGLEDAVEGYELRNEVDNRIADESDARRKLHADWGRQ